MITQKPRHWQDGRTLGVLGTGYALPADPVDTDALLAAALPHESDRRLRQRAQAMARHLGISRRHLSRALETPIETPRPGQSNPELAAQAVSRALDQAGLAISDVDFLIGHTATPALPIPSNIALVADQLGYGGPVTEFRQACTGFVSALLFAQGLALGNRIAVIVGSETGSLFFDSARMREDEGQLLNFIQMGDAAGAIVLTSGDASGSRITSSFYGNSGLGRAPGFFMASGGSNQVASDGVPEFTHDFESIRTHGPALFADAIAASGADATAFTHVIPHQANGRLDTILAPLLGIPADRIFINANHVGNTGSAAMWLAFAQLRQNGLAAGETVLALGAEATKYFHGGFTYVHG